MLRFPFIVFLLLFQVDLLAQNFSKREEIDQKRLNIDISDPDALTSGRDFVRADSTYYVGWMFQGLFLHDRSADR
ncbi:MAG: hypothetical protein MUE71_12055, partial [Chitinophagaceae bacterium]|nr:hypothetical protein [Chitinophagaceae bacterium]